MRGVLLSIIVLAGCREAVQPFSADHYGQRSDSVPVRLTFNSGTDEAPTWSQNGDTVYYAASAFPGLNTGAQGVLLGIEREGGPARLMLPALQLGLTGTQHLTTPLLSRDGKRVAFFDVSGPELLPLQCTRTVCSSSTAGFPSPLLASGRLRVRDVDAVTDQAALGISFIGVSLDPTPMPPRALPLGVFRIEVLPFQHRYALLHQPTFRPSWSPDGARLVFSDGLSLLLWQPGSATPTAISGTEDGVWAAWSPDGQWIAYTHVPRGNQFTISCECQRVVGDAVSVVQYLDLIGYEGSARPGTLTLIRPDGTGKRVLGDGEAPAWLPDNSALIIKRGSALWRINPDGSGAIELPNTEGGSSPSVSADGRYLAYSRLLQSNIDIWVLPLAGGSQ